MTEPVRRNSFSILRGLNAELDSSSAGNIQGRQWQQTTQLFHTRRVLKDFEFFRGLDPSVQAKLPGIVHVVSEKVGTVVFRQGDAPGHCYIVLGGQVAVWRSDRKEKEADREDEDACQNQPQNFESRAACLATPPDLPDETLDVLDSGTNTEPLANDPMGTHISSSNLPPVNVEDTQVECKSDNTQHDSGNVHPIFGTFLLSLGPGSIFGELALLEEQPRKATITCTEDCEFLIIKRVDFDSILKGEIRRQRDEKLEFLKKHLPGMRDLTEKKIDMVFYKFEKKCFPRGHAILKQGTTSTESIFLVSEGTVALRCKEKTKNTSPSQFRQLGVLVKGSLFGSSVADGMPEPFSAIVTMPCEVLCVLGADLKYLPQTLMSSIRKYLAQAMLWHLKGCAPDLRSPTSGGSPASTRPSTPAASASSGASRSASGSRSPSVRGKTMIPCSRKLFGATELVDRRNYVVDAPPRGTSNGPKRVARLEVGQRRLPGACPPARELRGAPSGRNSRVLPNLSKSLSTPLLVGEHTIAPARSMNPLRIK